jgi:hypothetical protein
LSTALLRGRFFHDLCADIDTKTDIVLHEMILVLSHLFGRHVARETDDPEEAEAIKRSASIVYLPPMPEKATKLLRKHNRDTLDIFSTYVKSFAAQHVKEEQDSLPLTHTHVGRSLISPPTNGTNGDSKTGSSNGYLRSLPAPHARSAFFALSGLGDDFTTIEDLCSSTREGVFLEAAVIPHLEIHPDETRTPLNAYLLDFYMHGALEPLELANGIRKSDVTTFFLYLMCSILTTSLGLVRP